MFALGIPIRRLMDSKVNLNVWQYRLLKDVRAMRKLLLKYAN